MLDYDQSEQAEMPDASGFAVKIIGVGGAGANVLDRMALEGTEDADMLTLNTDVRALSTSVSNNKIQLGKEMLKGMGAGGDPELGRQAALEVEDQIRAAVKGHAMVFICAGLGGGTGSGAAPQVCRIAKEEGVFLVAFTTLPFSFEGARRMEQAKDALGRIAEHANAVVTFENDRMGSLIVPKDGIQSAFAAADKTISESVRATTNIVTQPGIIRIGMDDLLSALRNRDSRCLFGYGQAKGDNRAQEALQQALKSPLLDKGRLLDQTRNVLVHVSGGDSLTLFEVELLMKELNKHVGPKTQIMFGVGTDKKIGGSLAVTLISSLSEASAADAAEPESEAAVEPEPDPDPVPAPAAVTDETPDQDDPEKKKITAEVEAEVESAPEGLNSPAASAGAAVAATLVASAVIEPDSSAEPIGEENAGASSEDESSSDDIEAEALVDDSETDEPEDAPDATPEPEADAEAAQEVVEEEEAEAEPAAESEIEDAAAEEAEPQPEEITAEEEAELAAEEVPAAESEPESEVVEEEESEPAAEEAPAAESEPEPEVVEEEEAEPVAEEAPEVESEPEPDVAAEEEAELSAEEAPEVDLETEVAAEGEEDLEAIESEPEAELEAPLPLPPVSAPPAELLEALEPVPLEELGEDDSDSSSAVASSDVDEMMAETEFPDGEGDTQPWNMGLMADKPDALAEAEASAEAAGLVTDLEAAAPAAAAEPPATDTVDEPEPAVSAEKPEESPGSDEGASDEAAGDEAAGDEAAGDEGGSGEPFGGPSWSGLKSSGTIGAMLREGRAPSADGSGNDDEVNAENLAASTSLDSLDESVGGKVPMLESPFEIGDDDDDHQAIDESQEDLGGDSIPPWMRASAPEPTEEAKEVDSSNDDADASAAPAAPISIRDLTRQKADGEGDDSPDSGSNELEFVDSSSDNSAKPEAAAGNDQEEAEAEAPAAEAAKLAPLPGAPGDLADILVAGGDTANPIKLTRISDEPEPRIDTTPIAPLESLEALEPESLDDVPGTPVEGAAGLAVPPPPISISPMAPPPGLVPTDEVDAKKAKGDQAMLDLEPTSKGRFAKSEPTIVDGQDLDVPTLLRTNDDS